jgi:1-acyl-sn-glycerol-3-phosphate acyltransferase
MTKKVLGSDPFASGGDAPAETPARASKRPPSKPSKRPSAKSSKRPSKDSAAQRPIDEAVERPVAPRAPKVPAEAEAIAIDEVGAEASVVAELDARDERLARPQPEPEPEPAGTVEDRIRELESQLDVLLTKAGRDRSARLAAAERAAAEAPIGVEAAGFEATPAATRAADVSAESGVEVRDEEGALLREDSPSDATSDIVSSEYYAKQWGRIALRDRAEDVDEFGLDQEFASRARPVLDLLYTRWWRVETSGIEHVPADGPVILCANHAGAVPYDGLMLATALRREHRAHRTLRWLADDFVFHFPFMGVALNRLGAVRACQENAERLLRGSNVVGVFPEGVKGISKSYRDRYQLQRFGRGGHIKLALRTRTPLVPVAIVGSEETHPMLPTGPLAKLLNVPFVPITPTFPWLGPLGLMPLPSKWSITFLPPVSMDAYDRSAADDELLVGRLNEKVRSAIQDELASRVRHRASIFRG